MARIAAARYIDDDNRRRTTRAGDQPGTPKHPGPYAYGPRRACPPLRVAVPRPHGHATVRAAPGTATPGGLPARGTLRPGRNRHTPGRRTPSRWLAGPVQR